MVRANRFFWKLFFGHVLLLGLVLSVSLALLLAEHDRRADQDALDSLQASARSAALFWPVIAGQSPDEARKIAEELSRSASMPETRFTFILPDGVVWADSTAAGHLDNHRNRPEVQEALQHGTSQIRRWSHTQARDAWYVAQRVGPREAPQGVVRVSVPLEVLDHLREPGRAAMGRIAGGAFGIACLLAMGLARIWSIPLRRLVKMARRVPGGPESRNLSSSHVEHTDEIETLALSLSRMQSDLLQRGRVMDHNREVLEELIKQLRDGVIIADGEGRLVLVNPAAMEMLDFALGKNVPPSHFYGQPVEAFIPLLDLQEMLRPTMTSSPWPDIAFAGDAGPDSPAPPARQAGSEVVDKGFTGTGRSIDADDEKEPRERRVELRRSGSSVFLLARSTRIRLPAKSVEAAAEQSGRLLILTDITELARTMQVKSDFVANASHELRTPLTALRMVVDTLRTLDPGSEPASLRRYLDIMDRHVAWLEELIRDLLDLSKLESPSTRFLPQDIELERFVSELTERFQPVIARKAIDFHVNGSPDVTRIRANPGLLRMILDNLVDNAIKFTPTKGEVRLSWKAVPAGVQFEVTDTGCGIPIEDQVRVFERFYQVERARTGAGSLQESQRGTGLGLSIVRHATNALNGRVELHSTLGKGTRVVVTIPQAKDRFPDSAESRALPSQT